MTPSVSGTPQPVPPPPRRPRPFLRFVLLVAVGIGLFFVIRNGGLSELGIPDDDLPRVALLIAMLVFVASGLFTHGLRVGEVVRGFATWALILLVLVGLYANRDQLAGVAGRIFAAIAPGLPVSGALSGDPNPESVAVVRAGDGHFTVLATIDDHQTMLLVDTGASFVTLTEGFAASIGIDIAGLSYDVPINTANGMIRAASIVIGRLTVGSIERTNVPALVAPPGALRQSLLGMSFLDSLSSFTVSGDRLVLTP